MIYQDITPPSKPKIVSEEGFSGRYEIDGLYPGYGHTLGNSLRRIILSSLPGAAITVVKIAGITHEFSTIEGIKEDVITIVLNLKKIRMKMLTDEPQLLQLRIKGQKQVTAGDLETPGQVEIMNPELVIANLVSKNAVLDMEMTVEKGLGYVPRETLQKSKVEIGTIALDAVFTPIRRVNYEVENMRVGDRTDFNRLIIYIETDGSISPRQALEQAIKTMIGQLKAIVGFQDETENEASQKTSVKSETPTDKELLKTRVDSLNLSTRTINALTAGNIRTLGGLVRKEEDDLADIEGLGAKGIEEIKKALKEYGIVLGR